MTPAPGPIEIGYLQLVLAFIFIILAQIVSFLYGLGLFKDLTVGALRTFLQLLLMGYALKVIFHLNTFTITMSIFLTMVITAVFIIKGRVKEKSIHFVFPMSAAMLVSYALVSFMVTGMIIGAKPWWEARYFIPITGMVIGNSMNALALALERLFSDLRAKKDILEMKLALGADYREASHEIMRSAVTAGMIPSINAMMGVGIVFIPGMMTGQILAGADPLLAIRYQIVVMLMLVGSTALGSFIVISLVRKRCFGKAQQLIIKQ